MPKQTIRVNGREVGVEEGETVEITGLGTNVSTGGGRQVTHQNFRTGEGADTTTVSHGPQTNHQKF